MITNRKYLKNKKNGGIIPPLKDARAKLVPVGCQDCMECRKQKQRAWQVRLLEDIKENRNGKMVTLTLSNESIAELNKDIPEQIQGYDRDNAIATRAMRLFLERWRKKYKKSIRHWLVTELGHNGTENIHMHGIMWTNEHIDKIREIWNYGWIWPRPKYTGKTWVNGATVNYSVKYVSKMDKHHKGWKSKILTTPGIGRNYTTTHDSKQNKFNGKETKETYRTSTGHQIALPIYWRNKIYTDDQRETLWLIKLDKNERWVCGERIDVSKGDQEYYQLLKWHRERNTELGYGSGCTTWERQQYERERRTILLKMRIANQKNPQKSTTTFIDEYGEINTQRSRLSYQYNS